MVDSFQLNMVSLELGTNDLIKFSALQTGSAIEELIVLMLSC